VRTLRIGVHQLRQKLGAGVLEGDNVRHAGASIRVLSYSSRLEAVSKGLSD
jgi:hypothetical protein